VVRFLKLDGALLFDENFFIIGDHFLKPELEQKCLDLLYNSVYSIKNINPIQTEDFFMKIELLLDSKSQEKCFTFIEIKHKTLSLYLLTMGNKKVDHEALEAKFMSMCELFETIDYIK
ncbi:MAG: hypothetical protein LUQ65_11255, partial [Candidatus Helarchaeota archaeon]|nr:hypothetical protein [Candidatus Helarchaeota archaeon]